MLTYYRYHFVFVFKVNIYLNIAKKTGHFEGCRNNILYLSTWQYFNIITIKYIFLHASKMSLCRLRIYVEKRTKGADPWLKLNLKLVWALYWSCGPKTISISNSDSVTKKIFKWRILFKLIVYHFVPWTYLIRL